ncbi:unnamed protein product, partial [Oppiella nova]
MTTASTVTTTDPVMDVDQIRHVFDNSQHLHKMQKCVKQMKDMYQQYSSSDDELMA